MDEVGEIGTKVGFGKSGTGNTGDILGAGYKREGLNLYDSSANLMLEALGLSSGVDFVSESVLQYDFDNGLATNDAFGFFFGISDLGLGYDEVMCAPGDSGGPTFINNEIAGITSYGITLAYYNGATSDILSGLNSSFGEFAGDTRVSYYASFVDNIINPVPEPSTCLLFLFGLLGIVGVKKKLS